MTIWNSTCNPCFSTFDQFFLFVFHGLKTVFFCYSLKLNFICYPNRFFTYDYSLWDGGDIRFCGQKQTIIRFFVLYDFVLITFPLTYYFRSVCPLHTFLFQVFTFGVMISLRSWVWPLVRSRQVKPY